MATWFCARITHPLSEPITQPHVLLGNDICVRQRHRLKSASGHDMLVRRCSCNSERRRGNGRVDIVQIIVAGRPFKYMANVCVDIFRYSLLLTVLCDWCWYAITSQPKIPSHRSIEHSMQKTTCISYTPINRHRYPKLYFGERMAMILRQSCQVSVIYQAAEIEETLLFRWSVWLWWTTATKFVEIPYGWKDYLFRNWYCSASIYMQWQIQKGEGGGGGRPLLALAIFSASRFPIKTRIQGGPKSKPLSNYQKSY